MNPNGLDTLAALEGIRTQQENLVEAIATLSRLVDQVPAGQLRDKMRDSVRDLSAIADAIKRAREGLLSPRE